MSADVKSIIIGVISYLVMTLNIITFIDIGSGTLRTLFGFRGMSQSASVYGIDVDEEVALNFSRALVINTGTRYGEYIDNNITDIALNEGRADLIEENGTIRVQYQQNHVLKLVYFCSELCE